MLAQRTHDTEERLRMDLFDLLTVSGAFAWLFIAWRSFQWAKHALARLRWALWGYRNRHKRATWPQPSSDRCRGFRQRREARETANHRPLS
jgi:hypothetical protein